MQVSVILYSAFLVSSLVIGIYAGRRIHNKRDYHIAGGQIPWYVLCGTFAASNTSAGLFLGATDMASINGYALWSAFVPTSLGFFGAMAVVGVLVKRLGSQYEIYDFADILAVRYPNHRQPIRMVIGLLLPVVYIPTLAAQFIALTAISASIFELPFDIVLMIVVTVVVTYTVVGGMLGVVWTDAFQFLVLLTGLIISVPVGMSIMGDGNAAAGWARITSIQGEIFTTVTPTFSWYAAAGQLVFMFSLCAQPHLVTRFLTAKSEREVIKALPVCMLVSLPIYASVIPIGLMGRLTAAGSGVEEHVYLVLARETLGPIVGTIVLIGIAAAAISTLSTIMMVTGQSFACDVYMRFKKGKVSEVEFLRASRYSVLIVGLIAALFAYFRFLNIFWLVVLSSSLLAAIFFVPLVLGFFSRRANGAAALASMLTGAVATIIVYIVNQRTGSNWFVSEFFGGLFFSYLAWWLMTRSRKPGKEEEAVLLSLVRPQRGT